MGERAIVHLNIIGFRAAVAVAKDRSLSDRPFVIAGTSGGRSLALDCSPRAIKEGINPGMSLALARRRVKDITILSPDPTAYETMNSELEKVASYYAPVWENDRSGNLYLDITGTSGLFGPPADCGSRILRDIHGQADIYPAAAVACNKLVSKVATRAIRPTGLIQIQSGTETEFLAHQDIRILPGMGPGLLRTATVTGMREIGEIAALSVSQALALFGKQGPLLRNMAQGIDGSRVEERKEERSITRQADFNEDIIDETLIRGAIEVLSEHSGLEMRRDKLETSCISLTVVYADGVRIQSREKLKRPHVLDRDIAATAERIFRKTATRRLRLRSLSLSLEALSPLGYEVDLFEAPPETKNRKLQEAVDKIQNRYGVEAVTRGVVLVASCLNGGQRLLPGPAAYS